MKESKESIDSYINTKLTTYLQQLDDKEPKNVYRMVMSEVEAAVIRTVMTHCANNQSKAAIILGISRVSLRKKIKEYNIYHALGSP